MLITIRDTLGAGNAPGPVFKTVFLKLLINTENKVEKQNFWEVFITIINEIFYLIMTADFFRTFADGQLKVQQIICLFESKVKQIILLQFC